jgi:DNA-binding beta-propeller fold protein YncE
MRRLVVALTVVLFVLMHAPSAAWAQALGTLEASYNFHASGLLADPTRPYEYATTGSELEVINTNTLAITATVALPGNSYGMAMSNDGSKLYIGGSGGVYVMDAQSHALLSTLNVGSVSQVATGLNNRLYVLESGAIAQIDATSGASTGPTMPVDVYSGGIQISPDQKTLYYATYGLSPGSLYKMDVSTTTPSVVWGNSDTVGYNGENLTLSHNGSMIAYACGAGYYSYSIPNYRTSDMSLLGLFNTGAYPNAIAYSPDDKLAYALHSIYPTAVDVYNTATDQMVGQFAVTDESNLMNVDARGMDLFVSFNGTFNGDTDLRVYSVPEPGTLALLGIGAMSLLAYAWRRRQAGHVA